MRVILASGSPRRKELLSNIGLRFEIMVDDSEEIVLSDESPKDAVMRLSMAKAKHIADKNSDALVIGADTVVSIDNKILGKPSDEDDAFNMLKLLSGRVNTVYTGVSIIDTTAKKVVSDYVSTNVKFRNLSNREIFDYIKSGEPIDKAGAYGIQEFGSLLIEGIDGDYFNVVGLPICRLGQILKEEFNINLL